MPSIVSRPAPPASPRRSCLDGLEGIDDVLPRGVSPRISRGKRLQVEQRSRSRPGPWTSHVMLRLCISCLCMLIVTNDVLEELDLKPGSRARSRW